MFWQDIPIPSGLGHILTMLFEAVGRGLSGIGAGLRTPHNLDARATLRVLRRLEKILRLTYVMAATHMTNVPPRPAVPLSPREATIGPGHAATPHSGNGAGGNSDHPAPTIPGEGRGPLSPRDAAMGPGHAAMPHSGNGDSGHSNSTPTIPGAGRGPFSPRDAQMGPGHAAAPHSGNGIKKSSDYGRSAYEHAARQLVETGVWQPPPEPFPNAKFKLWRTLRTTKDTTEKRPQPAHLIGAKPDLIRLVQRKLAELRDGMDHGMRYIISYAQDFAADVIYLPVHPPETVPPRWQREFWDEYRTASREARFQISEYWRRRRDQRRREDSS
jgi:hypothetical protein